MRDAAVERLAKLISEEASRGKGGGGSRLRRASIIHFRLEEGWFSVFLVAAVVYSTIWSIQAAGWVDHLQLLSLTTLLGLVIGLLAAKQEHLPRWGLHAGAFVLGLILAFWQTSGAFYHNSLPDLLNGLMRWGQIAVSGGTSDDDSIFLLLILLLGFALAYTSAWLIYRTRSPWLMILANAIIILINLSNLSDGYIVFLIVFLIASLLLLLRFNLHESLKRWRKQGLRYADDIGWDFMQTGALVSIGILIFSWLLPAGYNNAILSQIWNVNATSVQNTWERVIALNGGSSASNHGNFRNTLVLGGNPHLNQDIVMTMQTDGEGSQYLQFITYDTYSPQGWSVSTLESLPLKANQPIAMTVLSTHIEKQAVTLVNPPGEQYPYLGGASAISSISVPATVMASAVDGSIVAWVGQHGSLPAGTTYTVSSSVSSADIQSLRSVPMPSDAPQYPSGVDAPLSPNYYDQNVLKTYTQLPVNLDPRIDALAKRITSHAKTMYDKAVAIETYLRTNYSYSVDIQHPANEDGVSWFLFDGPAKGYCNYFASAMALLARAEGIPARVVAGYTHGTYDAKSHRWIIRGSDAHAWTQVYFAGYGWINFEPSASFDAFTRPLPNQFASASGNDTTTPAGGASNVANLAQNRLGENAGDLGSGGGSTTPVDGPAQLHQRLGMTFGALMLLLVFSGIAFALWWRRLFRRYGLATQLYGRLCMLAGWAGIRLRPSQTPYEYTRDLAKATSLEADALARLGDIYVRSQWADPGSKEHPRNSGEMAELTHLWRYLQPRMFFYVLRHPHFLCWLPEKITHQASSLWKRRRRRSREQNF